MNCENQIQIKHIKKGPAQQLPTGAIGQDVWGNPVMSASTERRKNLPSIGPDNSEVIQQGITAPQAGCADRIIYLRGAVPTPKGYEPGPVLI